MRRTDTTRTPKGHILAEKITDKLVRSLEAPNKGNKITYDTELKGFGIRVTAAGSKSFILNYYAGARERRITIGPYPAWSVVAARDEAASLRKEINRGRDPMGERHADRAAPTVSNLIDRFIADHAAYKAPRTRDEYTRQVREFVKPAIGRLKVADVAYEDIDRLHKSMRDRPYLANRVLATVSKMFNLAIRWRMRADNPAKGVERFHEDRRERFLSQEEIARLSETLTKHKNQTAANIIRFLMLTGARKGEALHARWAQFDLERGLWIKPSSHTKQRRKHRVPLSAPARQMLSELQASAPGEYVFPGLHGAPFQNLNWEWGRIRKAAGLENVRIHDLRHTFASILASAGLSLPIVGQLLGHTQTQTTARYAHLFDEPLREATERVGAVVSAAGEQSAPVIEIAKVGHSDK